MIAGAGFESASQRVDEQVVALGERTAAGGVHAERIGAVAPLGNGGVVPVEGVQVAGILFGGHTGGVEGLVASYHAAHRIDAAVVGLEAGLFGGHRGTAGVEGEAGVADGAVEAFDPSPIGIGTEEQAKPTHDGDGDEEEPKARA